MIDEGTESHGATERQSSIEDTAQHPPVEVSPDEKLSEPGPSGPRVPGAESIESEIRGEVNPNTE